MKVYVVTEHWGEYSQQGWGVKAAFATKEAAEEYADALGNLPGITGEYSPGKENEYTVDELEVWVAAPERIMVYHVHEYLRPSESLYTGSNAHMDEPHPLHAYRSEEYGPPSYKGYFYSRLEHGSDGWATIEIAADSMESLVAEYKRLRAEWPVDAYPSPEILPTLRAT